MNQKIKELIPYIIIVAVVILIRTFLCTPVEVIGSSMENNLFDGQILILNKIGYNINGIKRFDIIVIKTDEKIIKRVIGLPGEYVSYKNNKLYINEKEVQDNYSDDETKDFTLEDICDCDKIPEGYYLVLGDNRDISKDSRYIGLIPENEILGKTSFRIWPLTKFGKIDK